MQIEFKTKNQKQLEAVRYWIDNTTEQILYGGAKGGGKSFLGVSLIFGDALIYPQTHYFIARKELNDLRKYTIPTVHEVFQKWGLKFDDYASFNGQDNCFNLYNGSKVFLIACKDEPSDPLFERFGSMQMTRGMIEEGGEVAERAKANLWLSIGRWKNTEYNLKKKLLITANPKKGWMKTEFVDPYIQGTLSEKYKYIQALATDNPYLPQDYLDTLAGEKNTITRQRLWEGNWDYDDDQDSIISGDALTDVFSNTIVKDNNKYMIVDVARKGKDSTAISYWEGLELYKIEKFQKQSTEQTEQKIKAKAIEHRVPYSHIIIDEDGIGGGVVDHLFGVKGFVANSSPLPTFNEIRLKQKQVKNSLIPKTNFKNLKSQCGFKLAELINEHKISILPQDYRDEIITDLTAILREKNQDSDGKRELRSKEDVKIEIGRSPDVGDTILMRMYFELMKDQQGNNDEVIIIRQQMENKFMATRNNQHLNSAE